MWVAIEFFSAVGFYLSYFPEALPLEAVSVVVPSCLKKVGQSWSV
jgi:hypothetical protein